MDEAEGVLLGAVRVLRASGMDWETAYGEMLLARVHLARGELDEAERLVTSAIDAFTSIGTRMTAFEASLVRCEIASAAGDFERSLSLLSTAEEARQGRGGAAARAVLLPAGDGAPRARTPGGVRRHRGGRTGLGA